MELPFFDSDSVYYYQFKSVKWKEICTVSSNFVFTHILDSPNHLFYVVKYRHNYTASSRLL